MLCFVKNSGKKLDFRQLARGRRRVNIPQRRRNIALNKTLAPRVGTFSAVKGEYTVSIESLYSPLVASTCVRAPLAATRITAPPATTDDHRRWAACEPFFKHF